MSEIPQGAIRFNTNTQKLEFYAQGEWWIMSTDTPNLGTSSDVNSWCSWCLVEEIILLLLQTLIM